MASRFYLVKFDVGDDGGFDYPRALAGVEWRSATYHPVDASVVGKLGVKVETSMIGQTDTAVDADGDRVVAITAKEAQRIAAEYRDALPDPPRAPPARFAEEAAPPPPATGSKTRTKTRSKSKR